MELERKDLTIAIKTVDAAEGIVEGHAAVFGNLDEYNDVIAPGAFARTLKERGLTEVRVFYGHSWGEQIIGVPLLMEEDTTGLFTRTQLIKGIQAADETLLAASALAEHGQSMGLSIGYESRLSRYEERDDTRVRILEDIDLYEYSLVPIPANRLARVEAVKSHEDKGAIASHGTATDTEAAWDAGAALREAPNDAKILRYMHAWADGEGDADAKGTYKFPHHNPPKGPAVIAGVNNALARLKRSTIPDSDKAGVERHLRRHRKDAGLDEEAGLDLDLAVTLVALEPGQSKDGVSYVRSGEERAAILRAAKALQEMGVGVPDEVRQRVLALYEFTRSK